MSRYALSVVAVLISTLGFLGFASVAHAQTPPVDTPLYQTETSWWFQGDGATMYQSHRETNDLRGVELGTVPWESPVYAGACVNQGFYDPCYGVYKDEAAGLEYQGWLNNRDLKAPEGGWNISPQGGVGQPSYWEQGNGFIYRPGPVYNDAYYKGFESGVGRSQEIWGYGYDAGVADTAAQVPPYDQNMPWVYDPPAVRMIDTYSYRQPAPLEFAIDPPAAVSYGDPRLQGGYINP